MRDKLFDLEGDGFISEIYHLLWKNNANLSF